MWSSRSDPGGLSWVVADYHHCHCWHCPPVDVFHLRIDTVTDMIMLVPDSHWGLKCPSVKGWGLGEAKSTEGHTLMATHTLVSRWILHMACWAGRRLHSGKDPCWSQTCRDAKPTETSPQMGHKQVDNCTHENKLLVYFQSTCSQVTIRKPGTQHCGSGGPADES